MRALFPAAAVATTALAVVAPAPSSARVTPLSAELLVQRMIDPASALAPLPFSTRMVMPSSHDRNGGNQDGGSTTGPFTAIGILPPTFVRKEDGGFVLMEFHQPGCLLRVFMSSFLLPDPVPTEFGRLQVFVDGESRPSYDRSVTSLFAGNDPRYPRPLVGNVATSSGGNFAMVPFCFARSLKVRTTQVPLDLVGYWQANVLLAAPGTPVVPYTPTLDLRDEASRLARAAYAPAGAPAFSAEDDVSPDAPLRIPRRGGRGTLRYLRFAVRPFDIATLQALRLRVTADGAPTPQIDVPLGSLFGDGIEVRPIVSKAFGMDPARGTGYLALPVPFTRGATIAVTAARRAHVRLDGWRGPRAPARAGLLYGEHHVERAAEGLDTRILDAGGSGRIASVVEDDLDGGPVSSLAPLQRFLEGDDRVHVDGLRSPDQYGTGHEEVGNGGYYYVLGPYAHLFGGAGPLGSTTGLAGTQSQYRVFTDDAVRWSTGVRYGMEHGGGDEQPTTAAITTFSYRAAATARQTDAIAIGDATSEAAHRLTGAFSRDRLTAYFEGEHDGNSTLSTVIAGGTYYPAPAPEASPEAVTTAGIRFGGPVAMTLRIAKGNRGVVLQGLFDQAPPLTTMRVLVDGRPAGVWASPWAIANPSKRWLEDSYMLPAALTRDKRRIRVTLSPAPPFDRANLFGLKVLSRSTP